MTKPGIWKHYKGGLYRVLFNAKQATNGSDEGRVEVVYISLVRGAVETRDEVEFMQRVWRDTGRVIVDPDAVHNELGDREFAVSTAQRFAYCGEAGEGFALPEQQL